MNLVYYFLGSPPAEENANERIRTTREYFAIEFSDLEFENE